MDNSIQFDGAVVCTFFKFMIRPNYYFGKPAILDFIISLWRQIKQESKTLMRFFKFLKKTGKVITMKNYIWKLEINPHVITRLQCSKLRKNSYCIKMPVIDKTAILLKVLAHQSKSSSPSLYFRWLKSWNEIRCFTSSWSSVEWMRYFLTLAIVVHSAIKSETIAKAKVPKMIPMSCIVSTRNYFKTWNN